MRKSRFMAAMLCIAALFCTLSLPALAVEPEDDPAATAQPTDPAPGGTGGLDWPGLDPVKPLTPDGTGTVTDNATDKDGKEFFTITTADEEVFYLVIDRQKSGDNVYFLNAVTVDDLMALAQAKGETVKPTTPSPAPTTTPEPSPEPSTTPEPDAKPGASFDPTTLLVALAVVAVGGGAGWYFKIYRPKHQAAAELEDYPVEPEFEDDGDDLDVPAWEEDGEGKE